MGADDPNDKFDVALILGATDDGRGRTIVRVNAEGAGLGELRPLEEGKAITGELVTLTAREGAPPNVYNIKTILEAPTRLGRRKGPPCVATQAYRDNYDRIFPNKSLN